MRTGGGGTRGLTPLNILSGRAGVSFSPPPKKKSYIFIKSYTKKGPKIMQI